MSSHLWILEASILRLLTLNFVLVQVTGDIELLGILVPGHPGMLTVYVSQLFTLTLRSGGGGVLWEGKSD